MRHPAVGPGRHGQRLRPSTYRQVAPPNLGAVHPELRDPALSPIPPTLRNRRSVGH